MHDRSLLQKDRELLKKELMLLDIPISLATLVYFFFDNCGKYAHYYVSEVCPSKWSQIRFLFTWQPNNTDTEMEFVRDWRVRCFELQGFEPIKNASEEAIRNIGVPLLHRTPSSGHMNGQRYDINAAFVPVCPLHEALKGTLFSSSETHRKQFVSSAITFLAVSERRSLTSQNCSSTTVDAIENFVSCGTVLPKHFKAKCREVLSSRKKSAKDFFFEALGYDSIFAKRSGAENSEFKKSRLLHLQEAYEKLYAENTDGSRDTSRWRQTKFKDICSSSLLETFAESEKENVDGLFQNDAARMSFKKFVKFGASPSMEAIISALISFDAIITDAVDSLALQADNLGEQLRNIDQTEKQPLLKINHQRKFSNRGGAIPHDSSKRLKQLLPHAATNVLSECCRLYQKTRKLTGAQTNVEFAFCAHGTTLLEKLNNAAREDTDCFKMPDNGHFYIALTMHAFSDYICSWMGKIHYCYILHSSLLNVPFQKFKRASPLPVLFESDGEAEQVNDFECTENLGQFLTTYSPNTDNGEYDEIFE